MNAGWELSIRVRLWHLSLGLAEALFRIVIFVISTFPNLTSTFGTSSTGPLKNYTTAMVKVSAFE